MRFGRLVAQSVVILERKRLWNCLCDCGQSVLATASILRSKCKLSCGCIRDGGVHGNCEVCHQPFCHKKSRPGRYCSHKCYWTAKINCQAWNRGKKGEYTTSKKGKKYGPLSDNARAAISRGWQKRRGTPRLRSYPSGVAHPMWKGGVTSVNRLERLRFSRTMQAVIFERDEFKCQQCGAKGVHLQVDHVKQWSTHPDLRFDPDNCRTLCMACHYHRHFGREIPTGVTWGHNRKRKV